MNKKYIMSIAIIVAGVVLTTSIASALTWSPPIEIGWGVEHDYETHAVTDRFGQVHVVWSTYPSYTRLYYNRFDGTQWTGAERIGGATWWVSGPRVAVDAAGNPHVLWNGIPGGGTVRTLYTHFDGISWSEPEIAPRMSSFAGLVVDGFGQVFASYVGTGRQVYFTRRDASGWSEPVAVADTACRYTYLSIDTSGVIYLSYCDEAFRPVFRTWQGDRWSEETVLPDVCPSDWVRVSMYHSDAGASDLICAGESVIHHWHREPGSSEWEGPIDLADDEGFVGASVYTFAAAGSGSGYLLLVSHPSGVYTRVWTGSEWLAPERISSLPGGAAAAAITSNEEAFAIWGYPIAPGVGRFILVAQSATLSFNKVPVVSIENQPYSVAEGASITISGSAVDPDGDPLAFSWDLDNDGVFETLGQEVTFSAAGKDGPSTQTVTLQACDDEDACGSASTTIEIQNAPPVIEAGFDQTLYSGDTLTLTASYSDPGIPDTHTAVIDFGFGGDLVPALVEGQNGTGTVSASYRYTLPGLYSVEVCVTDDDGGTGCDGLAVQVLHMPVSIDIKPGSDPNSINCRNAQEAVVVAILSDGSFDARTVDHTTVRFQGASETHVDKKSGMPQRHEEDVDRDGDLDLVFHFRFGDTNLTCEATQGVLEGQTFNGVFVRGVDSVRVFSPGKPSSTSASGQVVTPQGRSLLRVESDHRAVSKTGTWSVHTTSAAQGGSYIYSGGGLGDTLTFAFFGTELRVTYVQHPALGKFAIEVDGRVVAQVDSYAPEARFGSQEIITGLALSEHLLRIVPLEGTIAIDSFEVEAYFE